MNKDRYRWYTFIVACFVTSLITANIMAVKLLALNLPFDKPFDLVVLPAGIVVFPVSYIVGDILTEVYGYSKARQAIWVGFVCNLFAVIAIWLGGRLPPAPFWTAGTAYGSPAEAQHAYLAILGFAPRVLAASFVAYLAGEFLNSYVLARMKVLTRGKWLWSRTISSTVVGQFADSSVFVVVAFAGIIPASDIWVTTVSLWLVKSAYEVVATPLTYAAVMLLKQSEQEDVYDVDTDFRPISFR